MEFSTRGGGFKYVEYDNNAFPYPQTIGDTANSIVGLGNADESMIDTIFIMPNKSTNPDATLMIVVDEKEPSTEPKTYQYVYVGNINDLPSDVLTESSIVNDLSTGGTNKPLSAEQGRTLNSHVNYITCESNAADQVKLISDDGFELSTHLRLLVRMTNTNTNSTPKFNINNTGIKDVWYNGSVASDINTWSAGEVLDVYYDGTKYAASKHAGISISQNTQTEGGDYRLNIGPNSYDIGSVNVINLTANEFTSPTTAAQNVPKRLRKNGTIIIYRYPDRIIPLEIWQFCHTAVEERWNTPNCWNNLQNEKDCFVISFDTDLTTTFLKVKSFYRKKGLLVIVTASNTEPQLYVYNSNTLLDTSWGNVNNWLQIPNTKDIENAVKEFVPIKSGKNLLDRTKITDGKYLDSNGSEHSSDTYSMSDYLEVEPSTIYYVQTANGTPASNSSITCHCFYDSNKNFISSIVATTSPITTPLNCKYVRLSFRATRVPNQMMSTEILTVYEPYSPIGGYPVIINDLSGTKISDGTITPQKMADVNFSRLRSGSKIESATFVDATTYADDNFPQTIKKNRIINLKIDTLTTFTGIYIGWGKTYTYGVSFYIDSTNLYQINGSYSGTKNLIGAHGLSISTFLSVSIICSNSGIATLKIGTVGGTYTTKVSVGFYRTHGKHYCMSDGTVGNNMQLTSTDIDLSKDVWIFGDSYLSISSERWPYYIHKLDINNVAWFAFPGATTVDEYDDLVRALAINKPKYLVWCLGMNDADTSSAANAQWNTALDNLKTLCSTYSITLILATIPCVPESGLENYFKNDVVRNAGYRYIDFAKAVNAESSGATWYAGMLSSDNVHPTALGAQTLANQVLKDFPEILVYDNISYELE